MTPRERLPFLGAGVALGTVTLVATHGSLVEHMAANALFVSIAAPLLAVGLARPRRRMAVVPAAACLVAVQWTIHATPVLAAVRGDAWWQLLEHTAVIATSLAFWWAVLAVEAPVAALVLLAVMPLNDAVSVWLMATGHTAAGAAMVAGMMPLAFVAVLLLWRWMVAEERAARPGATMTTALAVVLVVGAAGVPAARGAASGDAARGKTLFVEGCSSCHGLDAHGVSGLGPSLVGAGAGAARFYLETGRMPLAAPGVPPVRERPRYSPSQIDDLVAYVASLGGPPDPHANPTRGDLALGLRAFTDHCAGCHQVVARGGVVVGGVAPALTQATPDQIAQAVRVGPYLMPRFSQATIDQHTLDSIARYVDFAKNPDNRGGLGIHNIGPVPEGLVAWVVAIAALLVGARLIGTGPPPPGDPRDEPPPTFEPRQPA
jgi:ubiquinol-cytochrome c reductase cytochrome c subunit